MKWLPLLLKRIVVGTATFSERCHRLFMCPALCHIKAHLRGGVLAFVHGGQLNNVLWCVGVSFCLFCVYLSIFALP